MKDTNKKINDKEVIKALNTLKQYCIQCTPNDLLDDCAKNCYLYNKFPGLDEDCIFLRIFTDFT